MMRIRLSRRILKRVGKISGIISLVLAASLGLHTLGRAVTPVPEADRLPVLYAPAVRRTEQYRRQAQAYLADMVALDRVLAQVVRQPERDVYALSRTAETGLRTAGRLDQAVSLDYPPSTLVSLQGGLQTATTGYLEAAMAINTWVGEPTEEHYLTALEALRLARMAYQTVEANPWLARSPATREHPAAEQESAPESIPTQAVPGGWSE
jgi:hypothetical protein